MGRHQPELPPIAGVLETVLYYTDQDRTHAFYSRLLGLRLLWREEGRSLFYRIGAGVLLLFDPEASLHGDRLPAHGARGPGHVCFRVDRAGYEAWKRHLEAHGVGIEQEVEWSRGRSFYFRDPSGNLLEIADADLWPP